MCFSMCFAFSPLWASLIWLPKYKSTDFLPLGWEGRPQSRLEKKKKKILSCTEMGRRCSIFLDNYTHEVFLVWWYCTIINISGTILSVLDTIFPKVTHYNLVLAYSVLVCSVWQCPQLYTALVVKKIIFRYRVSVENLLLYRTVASNTKSLCSLNFDGKLLWLLFALFVFSVGTCSPTLNSNYQWKVWWRRAIMLWHESVLYIVLVGKNIWA